jgi:hypothetical protein
VNRAAIAMRFMMSFRFMPDLNAGMATLADRGEED